MSQYRAQTLDQIESPVTNQNLADWLRGDPTDPIYSGLLISATSAVINYIQRDLLTRTWTLTYQDWPYVGKVAPPALSNNNAMYQSRIELPYTNLISVDSVTCYGEEKTTDDYSVIDQLPAQICFESYDIYSYYSDCTDPAIVVTYQAGFGSDIRDIPEEINQSILMIAGHMYLNRGCSTGDAMNLSGAKAVLQPFRIAGGVMF